MAAGCRCCRYPLGKHEVTSAKQRLASARGGRCCSGGKQPQQKRRDGENFFESERDCGGPCQLAAHHKPFSSSTVATALLAQGTITAL